MDKVLIVDDELVIRDILKTILSKEGYDVLVAQDGAEALEMARLHKPDVIITDYLMPKISGVDLCRALKADKDTKVIPVLIVTAYVNEKEEGLSAGAVDFITKPVDRFDLLHRVRSALKVRHIKNELQKIISYIAELEK